jgi:hypothetical protein
MVALLPLFSLVLVILGNQIPFWGPKSHPAKTKDSGFSVAIQIVYIKPL